MTGYGAGGAIAAGIGQLAYTGASTVGISLLAAGLLLAGLMLVRLGAVRRATGSQLRHRHPDHRSDTAP